MAKGDPFFGDRGEKDFEIPRESYKDLALQVFHEICFNPSFLRFRPSSLRDLFLACRFKECDVLLKHDNNIKDFKYEKSKDLAFKNDARRIADYFYLMNESEFVRADEVYIMQLRSLCHAYNVLDDNKRDLLVPLDEYQEYYKKQQHEDQSGNGVFLVEEDCDDDSVSQHSFGDFVEDAEGNTKDPYSFLLVCSLKMLRDIIGNNKENITQKTKKDLIRDIEKYRYLVNESKINNLNSSVVIVKRILRDLLTMNARDCGDDVNGKIFTIVDNLRKACFLKCDKKDEEDVRRYILRTNEDLTQCYSIDGKYLFALSIYVRDLLAGFDDDKKCPVFEFRAITAYSLDSEQKISSK